MQERPPNLAGFLPNWAGSKCVYGLNLQFKVFPRTAQSCHFENFGPIKNKTEGKAGLSVGCGYTNQLSQETVQEAEGSLPIELMISTAN